MFKISRVYFHSGQKKTGKPVKVLAQTSQGNSSIFSVHIPLIFIVFRLYKTVWGAVTVIWFLSVLLILHWCFGYPWVPSRDHKWFHDRLYIWVYICYLLTGITTALMPAFKFSPINITESLFTAKLVNLWSFPCLYEQDSQPCRPTQIHKDLIQQIAGHYYFYTAKNHYNNK